MTTGETPASTSGGSPLPPPDHGPVDHAPRHLTLHGDHLHAPSIALVVAGGIVGVAAREGLVLAVPDVDQVPVVIPLVNVLGAFFLGFLYSALARSSPPARVVGRMKLLIGTGFCGGLTTYSSLATDTAVLFYDSRAAIGLLYCLGTVLLGAGATFLGMVASAAVPEPDHARPQPGGKP